MKRLASTAFALCLCLALAAPALAQFTLPKPNTPAPQPAAPAAGPASTAAPASTAGWTTVTKLGVTFAHPGQWEVITDEMDEYAVGLLDTATNKGTGFGLVVDNPDDVIGDLKADAASFAELGPVTVSGQSGKLYEGAMSDGQVTGAVRIIALDKRSPDESGLVLQMSVAGQTYADQEAVFQAILDSTVIDPSMFGPQNDDSNIFIPNDDASMPDPTPNPAGMGELPASGGGSISGAMPPGLPGVSATAVDTSGWQTVERLGCSFKYPPEFSIVEDDANGVMAGAMDEATHQGVGFGLGKDDAEGMLRDMEKDSSSFETVGPIEISGLPGTMYRAVLSAPEDNMAGVAEVVIMDQAFEDGQQLAIIAATFNQDWNEHALTLQAMRDSVVIDPGVFDAVAEAPDAGQGDPGANRTGELVLVDARSFRDMVGRNETIEPDGSPDARFKLTITGPGTIVDMRLHNMDGQHSEWNSIPGDGNWAMAVYQGKTLLSSEADGSVLANLAPGENKLDIFVQDNNSIAGGKTSYELLVTFEDGSMWQAMVFP